MDTEVLETAVVESVEETDLYHRPGRITRISTMTNIISWVILAIGVFIFGYLSYSLVTSIAGAGPGVAFSQIVQAFITPLLILVISLFLFAVLQWLAEVVYLWMDIEENTRKA
ncbi:MAG: hypothetical protein WC837_15265 [Bellilinea sp.]